MILIWPIQSTACSLYDKREEEEEALLFVFFEFPSYEGEYRQLNSLSLFSISRIYIKVKSQNPGQPTMPHINKW